MEEHTEKQFKTKPRQRYTAGEKGYAVSPLPKGQEISDLLIFYSAGFSPSLSDMGSIPGSGRSLE